MKTLKKAVSVILCIAMMVSASACGKEEKEESVDKSLTLGTISENNYENDFIGIGCELGSEWTFSTEDEILEMNNLVSDTIDEDIAKAIEDADILYDMMATYEDGMSNININVENIGTSDYKKYDTSEIYEMQEESLITGLESMGAENVNIEATTVSIDGEEFNGLNVDVGSMNGIEMHQRAFAVKCGGKYLANVTITTFDDDFIDDVVNCFYLTD